MPCPVSWRPSGYPTSPVRCAAPESASLEQDIAQQQRIDNEDAMQDAARFARRVRKRPGLTQLEFSERIDVSLDTIRNWEQGKRRPAGAAKALLKVLDKAPETALRILG